MRKNLKILIAFIVVAALGMVAFILLKQTQPSVKTALPQKAAKLAKVKRINLVTLGDSLTEGIGDDKGEQGYSGRIAKKLKHSIMLLSLCQILAKQVIDQIKFRNV
ncbi:hypothetical protein GCM10025884_19230 [Leuconostoc gelidum subsp. gelidum]|nr:hypothetical protein GCM10025884_19230 [Leuconostoc gelidum subsp. gelidum]